jgi:hypothetical protein
VNIPIASTKSETSRKDLRQITENLRVRGYIHAPGAGNENEKLRRFMDRYDTLKRKYEHAARYPWLPVEPDPPEPD